MKFLALFTLIGFASAQYGAPSYDAPAAPTYNAPKAPAYNAPEAYDAPAPSYDAPVPTYDAPTNNPPAAQYGSPTPAYNAPAPTYDAPPPAYNAPAPAYSPPTAQYGAPADAYAPAQQYSAVAAPAEETSVAGGFDIVAIFPYLLAGGLAIIVALVFSPLLGGLFALKFNTAVDIVNTLLG